MKVFVGLLVINIILNLSVQKGSIVNNCRLTQFAVVTSY